MEKNREWMIQKSMPRCVALIRRMLGMLFCILISSILGVVLLCAAYAIPVERIDNHARYSAYVIYEEGTYPVLFPWCQSQLDNWTDSMMMLEAAVSDDMPLLQAALLNRNGGIAGKYPADAFVSHYVFEEPFTYTGSYPRYWHGFLIFLKPLLYFMSYSRIRAINSAFQAAMIAYLLLKLIRRKETGLALSLFLGYLMLMPVALMKSMQFSACYYIAILSGICACELSDRKKIDYLFLLTGIATAYFDFLTYPVITFGIPAVLCLVQNRGSGLRTRISHVIRVAVCWVAGYACMWASKWVIGSLLTEVNVVDDAFRQFIMHSSGLANDGVTPVSIWDCLSRNMDAFFHTPFSWAVCAAGGLFIGMAVTLHRNIKWILDTMMPFMLISLVPLLWYAISRNHASIHYWFTNKTLAVTVIALLAGFSEIAKKPKAV